MSLLLEKQISLPSSTISIGIDVMLSIRFNLFSLEAKRSSKSFNSLIVRPPGVIPCLRCSTYNSKKKKVPNLLIISESHKSGPYHSYKTSSSPNSKIQPCMLIMIQQSALIEEFWNFFVELNTREKN